MDLASRIRRGEREGSILVFNMDDEKGGGTLDSAQPLLQLSNKSTLYEDGKITTDEPPLNAGAIYKEMQSLSVTNKDNVSENSLTQEMVDISGSNCTQPLAGISLQDSEEPTNAGETGVKENESANDVENADAEDRELLERSITADTMLKSRCPKEFSPSKFVHGQCFKLSRLKIEPSYSPPRRKALNCCLVHARKLGITI